MLKTVCMPSACAGQAGIYRKFCAKLGEGCAIGRSLFMLQACIRLNLCG
ncbi:hypothetical protein TRIP_B330659 [uncultured Desulfatiglans sp.]|nr:hypothetical protein TRIP_B330659 [uncultured Desulfatiglans sp.]